MEEAVAIFERCGAMGWAERARSELGRIGGRRREQGLTPAERRVAALVAEGGTNREVAAALFLGERTVETHLSHIYAKGSIHVPEGEICFFTFDAPSGREAALAAQRAELDPFRVVHAVSSGKEHR